MASRSPPSSPGALWRCVCSNFRAARLRPRSSSQPARRASPYSLFRSWSFPTLAMYTMGVESETMLPMAFLYVLFQIRQIVPVRYLSLLQNRDHLVDRDAG